MVNSSTSNYSKGNLDVVNINTADKINLKKFAQNGQIQIIIHLSEEVTHQSLETL